MCASCTKLNTQISRFRTFSCRRVQNPKTLISNPKPYGVAASSTVFQGSKCISVAQPRIRTLLHEISARF